MPASGNNGNTNVINNLIKLDNFDNRNRNISNLNYTYQEQIYYILIIIYILKTTN